LQSEARSKPNEGLAAPLRRMQEFARNIARVSKESKLEVNEEDYVASFKVGLMDAVHSWCKGAKFSEICKVRLHITLLPNFDLRAHPDK
jgi:ATP-dependent RNA helicase DOB1